MIIEAFYAVKGSAPSKPICCNWITFSIIGQCCYENLIDKPGHNELIAAPSLAHCFDRCFAIDFLMLLIPSRTPCFYYHLWHGSVGWTYLVPWTVLVTCAFAPMSGKGKFPWGGLVRQGKGNAGLGLVLWELCLWKPALTYAPPAFFSSTFGALSFPW